MKHAYQLCCSVLMLKIVIAIKPAKITILQPRGLKFTIEDEGYSLIGVHYSINTPVYGVEPGKYNYDITSHEGETWVHTNGEVNVAPGDTVFYWLYVIHNNSKTSDKLLNQSFKIPDIKERKINTTSTTTTIMTKGQSQQIGKGTGRIRTKVFPRKDFSADTTSISISVTTRPDTKLQNQENETMWNKFVYIAFGVLVMCLAFAIAFIIYRSKVRFRNEKSSNAKKETTNPSITETTSVKYLSTTNIQTEDNVFHQSDDFTSGDNPQHMSPDSYIYDVPEQRKASGQYEELHFPNNIYLELKG